MWRHSTGYSARLLTVLAVMLRQPIKCCSFVANQSRTKTFFEIFERRVPHKIGSRSASTARIHTLEAPDYRVQCLIFEKIEGF